MSLCSVYPQIQHKAGQNVTPFFSLGRKFCSLANVVRTLSSARFTPGAPSGVFRFRVTRRGIGDMRRSRGGQSGWYQRRACTLFGLSGKAQITVDRVRGATGPGTAFLHVPLRSGPSNCELAERGKLLVPEADTKEKPCTCLHRYFGARRLDPRTPRGD